MYPSTFSPGSVRRLDSPSLPRPSAASSNTAPPTNTTPATSERLFMRILTARESSGERGFIMLRRCASASELSAKKRILVADEAELRCPLRDFEELANGAQSGRGDRAALREVD